MSTERCVSCGEPIPEGRQVCPMCEAMINDKRECRMDCPEMQKFRAMLDRRGIEWEDCSENGFCPIVRTHFWYKDNRWSVIHGYGSFGGYDSLTGQDSQLLEVYDFGRSKDGPWGWLTAEEAEKLIFEEAEECE